MAEENRVKENTGAFWRKESIKALEKIKEKRKGKKFKLIKISEFPTTYKEIEIKENENTETIKEVKKNNTKRAGR